jgi:Putative peptidoglycan binding domain
VHVLKSSVPVLLCLLGVSCGLSYGKTHKHTSKHPTSIAAKSQTRKPVKSPSSSKAAVNKTTTVATRGKAGAKPSARFRSSKPKSRAVARRPLQSAPTQERYREIQQALSDKGYYKGSVSGAWGADSTEALKHFQKDQSLSDSGKLDSLSLIALGLGPKRNLSARSTTESRPKDDNRRPEGSERP